MDSYKKQQQQQMKSFSSKISGGGGEFSLLGFGFHGLSKMGVVACAACACSFFYIALLLLTSANVCTPSSIIGSTTTRIMPYNVAMFYNSSAASLIGFQSKSSAEAAGANPNLNPDAAAAAAGAKSSSVLRLVRGNPPSNASAAKNSSSTSTKNNTTAIATKKEPGNIPEYPPTFLHKTSLHNIVFGIAASARLWDKRREYVKLWWDSSRMRGFVWLDKKIRSSSRRWAQADYPPYRISAPIDAFNYTNKLGSRSAIRISRIVSETFRIGLPDVHWFVMGDDDTVFIPENLVRVLSKYDHRRYYYIGSSSESHTQNLHFSYNMAYGGGGFAISYPLAKALEKMQDDCLHRYPYLFGSDDRIQACMAELGVPLVKEPGFHQFDIYGDAFGLLSAHPVSPLISIHHLDVIHPIFPNMTQVQALKQLRRSIRVDPGGILQQSICYDKWRKWSFSVAWGYSIQVYRGILPPRELELPARTFISWYRRSEDSGFPFSTRGVSKNSCEQPTLFYMDSVGLTKDPDRSYSTYTKETKRRGDCKWKMASPSGIEWIRVYKERTDRNWHQAPRRQCCRVKNSNKKNVEIEVGPCRFGEFIA